MTATVRQPEVGRPVERFDWTPKGLRLPIAAGRYGWVLPGVIVAVLLVVYYVTIGRSGVFAAVFPQTLALTLFALGWNVVGGYAGEPAFGNAAFFGVGAYGTVLLAVHLNLPPIVGIWLGAIAAMVLGLAIGAISLRFRGVYFALASSVFPLMMVGLFTFLNLQEVSFPLKVDAGVSYLGFGSVPMEALIAGVLVVIVVLASSHLERSSLGLLLRTVRADQHAAAACGVGVRNLKIGALVVSAGISAVAGALYAATTLVLTPDSYFGLVVSLQPVIFALVGGSGTVWGPVLGAGLLVPLQTVVTTNWGADLPGIAPLLYGVAVVLVVAVFPGGLYWQFRRLVGWLVDRRRPPVTTPPPDPVVPVAAFVEDPPQAPAPHSDRPVLVVRGVAKSFGGLKVLHDVSFEAMTGEILGVIGPNGAGKTTLFDIISGFVRADGGSATLDGTELLGLGPHRVCRAGVGRTFQTPRIFGGLTVGESVAVAARARVGERHAQARGRMVVDALDTMALGQLARSPVEALTTGEVRRLELARAFVGWPRIVFLDEFLGGIGGEETDLVLGGIRRAREHGCTIVAIEHTMHAMVGFVDRFVVLNLGTVCASGSAEQIGTNSEVVEAYLGRRWAERARG